MADGAMKLVGQPGFPLKMVDNGDGTFSPQIAAALELDPTDLNLEATQQLVLAAGLAIQAAFSNSFRNITTATTTTVKSGAGTLKSVTVNTLGTIASTVTIYDNTAGSGTKIGTIDSLTLKGTFTFDVAFATGLTLVTTGTVAPDITVSYR